MTNQAIKINQSFQGYLESYMYENDLSYRAFAEKFKSYISYGTLATVLAKDATGTYRNYRKIRDLKVAALLRAMGLSREETSQLLLRKMNEEAEVLPVKFGSEYKTIVKMFGNLKKVALLKPAVESEEEVNLLDEMFDQFDKKAKKRIKQFLLEEIEFSSESSKIKRNSKQLQNYTTWLRGKNA